MGVAAKGIMSGLREKREKRSPELRRNMGATDEGDLGGEGF